MSLPTTLEWPCLHPSSASLLHNNQTFEGKTLDISRPSLIINHWHLSETTKLSVPQLYSQTVPHAPPTYLSTYKCLPKYHLFGLFIVETLLSRLLFGNMSEN